MLEWWNQACLTVGDCLLGWSLGLPSDVTLLVVALLSAAVLTLVRLMTTNQDLLCRVAADKKRLRRLVRDAKRQGDRQAVGRYRKTFSLIAATSIKAEGLPLLAAIVPIAVLATWCIFRLGFHPPRSDEPVRFVVYTPISMSGQLIHVVPQDGVDLPDDVDPPEGWVKQIEALQDSASVPAGLEPPLGVEPPYGLAQWQLAAAGRPERYRLVFRLRRDSFEHDLLVGQPTYATPVRYQGAGIASALQMETVKLLGIVGGIRCIYFPPWLVAYLIIVIPLVPLLKRLMRVH